jgi:tetratricopeptide (TPR) repeat protein
MDSIINAAALALATGDVLGALKRVALRDDPPALALRGIAMAQLGDYDRARSLLTAASRGFGKREDVSRARCVVAEAEVALVSRDLAWPTARLDAARDILQRRGDLQNAAQALCIEARRHLLLGRLADARHALAALDPEQLPPPLLASHWLTEAGIGIRQLHIDDARQALSRALEAAQQSGIPALITEVHDAVSSLASPVALLRQQGRLEAVALDTVQRLRHSADLLVDATRNVVSRGEAVISLSGRPVLFTLLRVLAEAWPGDASRELLLSSAFRARHADESSRGRLRVEIARLRRVIESHAGVLATPAGFRLVPRGTGQLAVLTSQLNGQNAAVMALLADGELWASSALAIALDTSPRTVQRALTALQRSGKVQPVGQGRARRWTVLVAPGFPTTLHLPRPR